MKLCGWDADCMASMATLTEPSVPFLKPIGKEAPEASSRCNWDSVVLAPMAPQVIKSAMNWGLIVSSRTVDGPHLMVSRSSQPTGMPMLLMSHRSSLAILKPLLIWKDPSMSGSLISPFHPTVVLGFSLWLNQYLFNKQRIVALHAQVDPHDNLQTRPSTLLNTLSQSASVLLCLVDIVYRAWSDDN